MAHDCDNSGAYKGSYKRKTESKRRQVNLNRNLYRDINKAFKEFEKERGMESASWRKNEDRRWAQAVEKGKRGE